jgi:thiazole synthase
LVQDKDLANLNNIKIIIENANVPVIVDAGIGAPSEASTSNGIRC